jgi:hypothetical protein
MMDWKKAARSGNNIAAFADLETPVGRSGGNESTIFIAVLWLVVIANS